MFFNLFRPSTVSNLIKIHNFNVVIPYFYKHFLLALSYYLLLSSFKLRIKKSHQMIDHKFKMSPIKRVVWIFTLFSDIYNENCHKYLNKEKYFFILKTKNSSFKVSINHCWPNMFYMCLYSECYIMVEYGDYGCPWI